MCILVSCRRCVVQSRVPAVRVVPPLEEFEHRPTGLVPRTEVMTVQQLAFQRGEEALAQGIVVAVSGRSHRRPDTGFPTTLAEGDRRVLGSLVGVVDHPSRTASPDRHVQGVEDQLGT